MAFTFALHLAHLPAGCRWAIEHYGYVIHPRVRLEDTLRSSIDYLNELGIVLGLMLEKQASIPNHEHAELFRREGIEHIESRVDDVKQFIHNLKISVSDLERMERGQFVSESEEMAYLIIYERRADTVTARTVTVDDRIVSMSYRFLKEKEESTPKGRFALGKYIELMEKSKLGGIVCCECESLILIGTQCISKRGKGARRYYCNGCAARLHIV